MKKSRIAINLIFFLNGFIFVSWAARTPLIQDIFNLDYDQLGYILLASSLGSVVAMPIAGLLINRSGTKNVTFFSGLIFFCSIPLFTQSQSYTQLLACFTLMGASVGMMDVSMNGQAVEVEKRMGKPIMSFFHAMFSVGMMVGSLSVSLIEKLEIPLALHLLVVGSIAILIMVFIRQYLIHDDQVEQNEDEATSGFYFPKGPLVIFGLIAFCCMLGEGAMAEWTANYMIEVGGSTDYIAPFGLFAFSGAMALGRFLGDSARTKWGDSFLVKIGGMISTVGLSIAIIFPTPWLIITSLFVVGLGLSTIVPIIYSLAGNLPGVKAGVGISAVTTIGYSGFLFGPPIIGLLAETFSLRIAWTFVLSLFILMVLIVSLRKPSQSNGE